MLPTLRELSRVLGADLAPVWPRQAPPSEVSAVHVSELADPTRYLDGGELVLTTGLNLEVSALWCRTYLERLATAEVAGVALGLGPVYDAVPPVLAHAAEQARLPLFSVPAPTPFLTITRTYWSMLADSGQRELMAALSAHRALIAAAASPRPVAAVLRRLAQAVGGWAARLSVDGEVVAVAPSDRRSTAQELRNLLSRHEIGGGAVTSLALDADEVVVQPLGSERLLGYLAVGCPRPIPATAQQVTMTAVALLSLDAVHARRVRAARRAAPSAALGLLSDGDAHAGRRVAAIAGTPLPDDPLRPAVIVGAAAVELLDAIAMLPRSPQCVALAGEVDGACCVLLASAGDLSQWFRSLVHAVPSARGAIEQPLTVDDLAAAFPRLRRSALHADAGTLTDHATSPAGLREHLQSTEVRAWAEARLAPLLTPNRRDLLTTLASYLRHRGEWEPAARELGVHRHTIRNRITRIAELLALDLDNPDVTSELWLALRISARA